MYAQITNRCNMHCEHCCFDCTSRGSDMSLRTLKKLSKLISALLKEQGNMPYESGYCPLYLGGGEPTLHPHFWRFFGEALCVNAEDAATEGPPVCITTNGSNRDIALKLIALAHKGCVSLRVSMDPFHAELDPVVKKELFKHVDSDGRGHDNIQALTNIHRIYYAGRATRISRDCWWAQGYAVDDGCGACGPVVTPDGKIWECGCFKQQIGDVDTGYDEATMRRIYDSVQEAGGGSSLAETFEDFKGGRVNEDTCTTLREKRKEKQ